MKLFLENIGCGVQTKIRFRKEAKMAGIFGLSVNPEVHRDSFHEDLFWGTFYQQHLGEEFCGLAVFDSDGKLKIETHHGLLRPNFGKRSKEFEGISGIGYCGSFEEPFSTTSRVGQIVTCFSGNVINLPELVQSFQSNGHIFVRKDDIEMINILIAQRKDVIEGIERVIKTIIKGAFSLLVLTPGGIYAVRSLNGHWPLIIGEKDGATIVASESGGFNNLGFKIVRDLKPGEIVLIKNGQWESKKILLEEEIQICSFLWVYTAFPNARICGIPASLVRKKLGATLARRDIERGFIPDIVAPVPDSGRFHAIGYHQEFCRQIIEGKINRVPLYDEILLKYPYAGRSYTPQTKEARDKEAHIKLLTSGEDYTGLTVVVCDDSIVRGTQTQTNLVPKLKSLGFREIHLRISNPELLSYCPWGKTTKRGDTLAERMPSIQERIRFLGVKSLEYSTIDDLVEAINIPQNQLCIDCDLKEK